MHFAIVAAAAFFAHDGRQGLLGDLDHGETCGISAFHAAAKVDRGGDQERECNEPDGESQQVYFGRRKG
jgi:hypothetical protein